MAVTKTDVLASKIGIVEAGDTVMVVQIIVIKLRVGVMPQLVVTGNNSFVIMKYFKVILMEIVPLIFKI